MNGVGAEQRSLPKRLVVKLGTSTLCDSSGSPDPVFLESLVKQIAELNEQGVAVVVVTSGAIRAGLDHLTLPHLPKSMPIKQAAAAVGQGLLMQLYAKAFAAHGLIVAQILLTRDDFHERSRYLNATHTLRALLKLGVIPIVNENDTIAVDEIKVGDNDTLAALVAGLVDAELLILLSDIDGLYDSDPRSNPNARLISNISRIDTVVELAGTGSKGDWGTGGMRTKIDAAKIAMQAQITMIIAHGRANNVLMSAIEGNIGTRFESLDERTVTARKRWIAAGQRPKGKLTVHDAARTQLIESGRSLLPAGVLGIEGEFKAGDMVVLVDGAGGIFAQGIVNYDCGSLSEIKGLQTQHVRDLYGKNAKGEVIHRDNMVVMVSN